MIVHAQVHSTERGNTTAPTRGPLFGAASHLAIWPGLYVTGAAVLFAQLSCLDNSIDLPSALAASTLAFCTAAGVYLLDRVKLRDAWLDPADAHSHPRRFEFLAARSTPVRALSVGLLIVAAIAGIRLNALAPAIPVLAASGVFVYAGRPRRRAPRPKDILIAKNAFVSAAIAGFALVVVLLATGAARSVARLCDTLTAHATPTIIAFGLLFLRVFADAVLCDLDDEAADRAFGTGTLPTRLGRTRAWNIAVAIRLALAGATLAIPALPLDARIAWAILTAATTLLLRAVRPARVRDWVDARLGIEAALATLALWAARAA